MLCLSMLPLAQKDRVERNEMKLSFVYRVEFVQSARCPFMECPESQGVSDSGLKAL